MTHEEALETLAKTQSLYIRALKESGYADEQIAIISEPQKIAIEALKKQIPWKPKMIKGVSGMEYGVCPACDSVTIFKFCANCGQAIDRKLKE